MKEALRRQFTHRQHLSEQIDLIDKAIALSKENIDDLEAIRELGQGWVAEETLAIAIYCSLKYSDDFDKDHQNGIYLSGMSHIQENAEDVKRQ